MNGVSVYIPTYGRGSRSRQITYDTLGPRLVSHYGVKLVVQEREYKEGLYSWAREDGVLVLPDHVRNIHTTRQWMLENSEHYLIMLDDDLTFAHREGQSMKLVKSEESDIEAVLEEMIGRLASGYAHVGVSAREGNNREECSCTTVGRTMRVTGYNTTAVKSLGARFDRVDTMEDLDMTLQLLRLGYPNLIMWNHAQNQSGGSNTPGGCGSYRTMEYKSEMVKLFHSLHPDFCKIVQKQTKTSWGGALRDDVTIYWKKAYQSSRKGDK